MSLHNDTKQGEKYKNIKKNIKINKKNQRKKNDTVKNKVK